jgi:GNAT superfamily N-acetyltransferase
MADFRIRHAGPADVAAIAAVHLRAADNGFRHIFPTDLAAPTHERLRADWSERVGADQAPGWEALVAHDRGEVVGVLTAGPDPLRTGAGQLSRLYVEPARWGQGIGRMLVDAALDGLHRRRFSWATLWCLEANHRARAWYERMGWRATGERKVSCERACGPNPAGVADVRYRLALAPWSQQRSQLLGGGLGAAVPVFGQPRDGIGGG